MKTRARAARVRPPKRHDYEVAMPVLLAMLRDECSRPRLVENVGIWGPNATPEQLEAIDRIDDAYSDPNSSRADSRT